MSMTSPSIDDELKIPYNATLKLQTDISASLELLDTEIRIDSSTSIRTSSAKNDPTTIDSIKCEPRCLIIGRQVSVSDIRLDHKSISRRHAVIYFLPSNSDMVANGDDQRWALYIQDLGGKKGTEVNQIRIPSGSSKTLLKDGDSIKFGAFQKVFRVKIRGHSDNKKDPQKDKQLQQNQGEDDDPSNIISTLSGRQKREAEIAAMIKSLDETPSYKYHHPISSTTDKDMEKSVNTSKADNQIHQSKTKHSTIVQDLPITHSTQLSSRNEKLITCLSMDPSGSRIITGSIDCSISMYDFGGMNTAHSAFKIIEEVDEEGRHPIMSISYSNTGDRFVVGTTSSRPSVFDRDGHIIIRFAGGDSYVTDMSKTSGHVSTITSTSWHPFDRDIILTSSTDGSVRVWDLSKGKTTFQNHLKCSVVYRIKNKQGRKAIVTCASYHPSGGVFAVGTSCGSIQIWKSASMANAARSRPDQSVYEVHSKARIKSLTYNMDGTLIASRGEDETVCLWDARRLMNGPNLTISGIHSYYDTENVAFSPDGKIICVGTSVKKNSGEKGKLLFYDCVKKENKSSEINPIFIIDAAPINVSAVMVLWHTKINQIFVGLSNGITKIFYSPDKSKKGALLSTSRVAKTKDAMDLLLEARHPHGSTLVATASKIMTPHALPMFRDDNSREAKRKRKEEREDPVKTRRPEPPSQGVKVGGQTSVQNTFQQFVAKSTIKNKNLGKRDPREVLFQYSDGKKYVNTENMGDVRILAEKTAEEEEDEMKKK